MKRFEMIDYLKGYAIFTIMIFHYLMFLKLPPPYSSLIYFGGTGIHLFILLSGFGLYFSHLHKPLPFGQFIAKRFTKVYIPYIFIVLISAILTLFIPIYDHSWYALGGHIFLYKMFDNDIMGSYGYPLWFISMILQFYLVFLVLVKFREKLSESASLAIALLVSLAWPVVVIYLGHDDSRVWYSFFLQYLWEFVLGMIIAGRVYENRYASFTKMKPYAILLVGLLNCAIYAFMALKGGTTGKLVNDIFALLGYSLVAVWFYTLNVRAVTSFFLFIGKISLSVYLLHTLILRLMAELFPTANPVLIIAAAVPITLVTAIFYQRYVDKFFRKVTFGPSAARA